MRDAQMLAGVLRLLGDVGNQIYQHFRKSPCVKEKRHENPAFTALMFVLLMAGLLATAFDPTGLAGKGPTISLGSLSAINIVLLAVGAAMMIAGFGIRFMAVGALGANFSGLLRIREGHTLVTSGIYHWVRHPAYLGAILMFLGFPVLFSSAIGFMVMLLLVPYLVHRIGLEERMLVEHFGFEYQEYMKHSKKLIPLVY
jgi:protein-S-isoprenylcysteine O-methyltransferase Ste14